ncbi:protein C-terminal S-isoprenylcysteine carboxyl O-methyltransferase [Arthrobacter sp. Hiyo8]|nr:protein C-terminal S-isoprenylcysteine carboxyl O-methyltransferase [Arthrobacter sp. Hiyo8]
MQAIAGFLWWAAVFLSPVVREATLGNLDPVAVAVFDIPLFVVASAVASFGVKAAALVSAGWTGAVAVALAVYATVTTEAGWGVLGMGAASAGSLISLCLVLLGHVPTAWIIRGPFAFRPAIPARPPPPTWPQHLGKLSCSGVLPGGDSVRSCLSRTALGGGSPVSVVCRSCGCRRSGTSQRPWYLGGRGDVDVGQWHPLPSAMPNHLVIAGPYRWIRNPMAAAGILQGAAVGVILQSWLVVAYAVVGSLVWNYVVRPLEESDLEERFGEEFRQYRDAVRCWVPRMSGASRTQER